MNPLLTNRKLLKGLSTHLPKGSAILDLEIIKTKGVQRDVFKVKVHYVVNGDKEYTTQLPLRQCHINEGVLDV